MRVKKDREKERKREREKVARAIFTKFEYYICVNDNNLHYLFRYFLLNHYTQ